MKLVNMDGNKLYIGTAREIKSLHKNMEKHEVAFSMFSEEPKFNKLKNYGLYLNYEEELDGFPTIEVWSADSVLDILFDL